MQAMRFLNKIINHIHEERYRKVVEFVFLWQDYNYWYNRKNPNLISKKGVPLDEERATKLSEDEIAVNIYNIHKDSFLVSFERIPSNLNKEWLRDRLLSTGQYQREVLYNRSNDSLKDFLMLIYQIRCNFIHGSKEGDEVDVSLIGWARDCLGCLLEATEYMTD